MTTLILVYFADAKTVTKAMTSQSSHITLTRTPRVAENPRVSLYHTGNVGCTSRKCSPFTLPYSVQ